MADYELGLVRTERGEFNPFDDFRRDRRWATLLALVLATLIHLLLGLTVVVVGPLIPDKRLETQTNQPMEIELVPQVEVVPEEPRYVEANPDVAQNEPDNTQQYSFRAQQAADENPDSDLENTPFVDGEEATQKIIQGEVSQPEPIEPGVYSAGAPQGEGPGDEGGKAAPATQAEFSQAPPIPPPAFLRQEPKTDDGIGSSLEIPAESQEISENQSLVARPIDVYRPATDSEVVPASEPSPGGGEPQTRPAPRARPRLPPELTRGPLMNSRSSASFRGALAIDATFSEFGEYQQQFYAALQAGWYQEIEFFEPIDTSTYVRVSFTIKADGSIHDVQTIDSNATEIARVICETAIIKRSPFRPWTKEMVKVFGNQRTLIVMFRYL
ncbi:MAG: hypothetical protein AAGH40_09445 [Verrucomicrobiota bacterium]